MDAYRWAAVGVWSVAAALAFAGAVLVLDDSGVHPVPKSADVRDLRCSYSPSFGVARMTATIVNSAEVSRDYELRVRILAGDVLVGTGDIVAEDVQPGETARITALGSFTPRIDPTRCTLAPS